MITDINTIAAEIVENTIPANEAPSCARELFLRPPDWRYQKALLYIQDEQNKITPTIPTDPLVQYTIKAIKAYKNIDNRAFVDVLWPELMEAIWLGTVAHRTAITAEVESCLICGRTARDIKEASFFVHPLTYELYSKIFFDLSGIKAIHAWFNDFLFEPEKYQSNQTLLRARLLAYFGGQQVGANSAVMGMENKEASALIKNISNTERQKKVFDYIVKHINVSNETYVDMMESAIKSMTERDFQEHMKDRDEAGSSSLEELANHLEQGIRAFSQQELDTTNNTGLDFVNQYTAAILRKDTDNGN